MTWKRCLESVLESRDGGFIRHSEVYIYASAITSFRIIIISFMTLRSTPPLRSSIDQALYPMRIRHIHSAIIQLRFVRLNVVASPPLG